MELDNKNEKIDSSNIFDDFTNDSNLKEEIDEIVQSQEKDIYYYFKKTSKYLQVFVVLMVISLSISYWYIYVQTNEKFSNSNLIDPFCFLILWDISNSNTYCSSVEALTKQYSKEYEALKQKQLWQINSIFENVYKIENFMNSKEVIFLKNKSESKIDVMWILNDFDNLLTQFEPIEKEKVKCFDIEISSDYKLKVSCELYSTLFEKNIKWFDWTSQNLIWWTSISFASSFINFIKTQSDKFFVISEDENLSSTPLLLENNWFTSKTKINLELQYNTNNIIF